MERQIEKYFQEELNADERLDFLKQVESDNELFDMIFLTD